MPHNALLDVRRWTSGSARSDCWSALADSAVSGSRCAAGEQKPPSAKGPRHSPRVGTRGTARKSSLAELGRK
eukprot:13104216-Alexandrium_andersonii.AAC.1